MYGPRYYTTVGSEHEDREGMVPDTTLLLVGSLRVGRHGSRYYTTVGRESETAVPN